MELLHFSSFRQLRLAQFHLDPSSLIALDHWEFMDALWIGEADGFTTFLRPADRPDELGSIELDLRDLPEPVALAILNAIHLPLRRGMSFDQIERLLGSPHKTYTFVDDRKSYDFEVGEQDRYLVSCTIHESDGVIFVGIIRRDLLFRI